MEESRRGFTTEAQRTQRNHREENQKREMKTGGLLLSAVLFSLLSSLCAFSVSSVPLW
jgi:hypothetical protein